MIYNEYKIKFYTDSSGYSYVSKYINVLSNNFELRNSISVIPAEAHHKGTSENIVVNSLLVFLVENLDSINAGLDPRLRGDDNSGCFVIQRKCIK